MGIRFGELVIILIIILIMFGSGKLPRVIKDIVDGIKGGVKLADNEEEKGQPEQQRRKKNKRKMYNFLNNKNKKDQK